MRKIKREKGRKKEIIETDRYKQTERGRERETVRERKREWEK
jgi:hypothetical protein